jgi:hypothetical protein
MRPSKLESAATPPADAPMAQTGVGPVALEFSRLDAVVTEREHTPSPKGPTPTVDGARYCLPWMIES